MQRVDPWLWKHSRKHVMGVRLCPCACVRVSARLWAGWRHRGRVGGCFRVGVGGEGLCLQHPPRPWIPAGVSSPGREEGPRFPQPTGGWSCQKPMEGAPPRGGGYADLTSLLCRFSAVRTKMVSFLPRLSHMKTWLLLVGRAGLGGCLCSVPLILRRDSRSSS